MQQKSSSVPTSEVYLSHFYSILRLRGDEGARTSAKKRLLHDFPEVRIDDTGKGDLCIDLSRERSDWLLHQQQVAISLSTLAEFLTSIDGCSGVVESAVDFTPDSAQILEVVSYRVTTPVITLLSRLGFEYELSVYFSRS
jgi:hypothetical protein